MGLSDRIMDIMDSYYEHLFECGICNTAKDILCEEGRELLNRVNIQISEEGDSWMSQSAQLVVGGLVVDHHNIQLAETHVGLRRDAAVWCG